LYKNRPQLAIVQVRVAKPEEIDLSDYLPHTKADIDQMWAELLAYAASIKNPWLNKLVAQILADPTLTRCYKRAPAAKVMHHAYIGGLLEHVLSLCGSAKAIAGHYPELDLDLLLTAAMLHDVGKLEELCYERAIGYTTPGQLLGHIVMELESVSRAIDKIEGFPPQLKTVVQHLLISHHGEYEFGSPKLPMIREALVFHYLDDLDSKIAAVRVALSTPSGDDEWSAYSGALGRKFLKLDEFLKASSQQPSAENAAPSTETTASSGTSPGEPPSQSVVEARNSAPADTQAPAPTAMPSATPPADPPSAPQPKPAEGLLRKLFS
jgi:3'-5' exoribonuclease